jgi:predicted AlkP superfamily phosphohydrolase/phosphomutase
MDEVGKFPRSVTSCFDPCKPSRQLLIGVDAMEWTLVQRWAKEGKLPTFKRLLQEGSHAKLASFADALPDAVWPALSFGVNPGKFEKYFYVQYEPQTSGLRYVKDEELSGVPFWHYASQAGKRVGVVDVPHLPPRRLANGFQVFNWGTHEPCQKGALTDPPELLSEIRSRFGHYPADDCEKYGFDGRSVARLRRDILAGVAQHGELFRWLMESQDWDLFVCCFCEAHCAGHHFWGYMDPSYPQHSETNTQGLADTVEQTYRAIDREIGQMVALAGNETQVFVFAAHGMGPLYHASWNLNEILDLLGYGKQRSTGACLENSRSGKINPWRTLKRLIPGPLQYAIKESLPKHLQNQLVFLWYTGGVSYRHRQAFAVPHNDLVGAIRIGVRGRDHSGVVDAGPKYRAICNDIAEALRELVDPVSGRRVVRKVTFLRDKYHGPFVERLPDLAVLWETSFNWSSLHSPRFGTLKITRQDRRSGSHSPNSFMLAVGPGIPVGAEITGCSSLDISTTILEAAGVSVPDSIEGKSLPLWSTPNVKADQAAFLVTK